MENKEPTARAQAGPGYFRLVSSYVVLAVAVMFLNGLIATLPLDKDVYAAGWYEYRHRLDSLPVSQVANIKLAHARTSPAYDIGLFGNSRSMMVSSQDLGFDDLRFFNFSLAGSSFRQSIMFLEILAAHDAAPDISVISLDHLELSMLANQDIFTARDRITVAMFDLADIWQRFGMSGVFARSIADPLLVEWNAFARLLDVRRVWAKLSVMFPHLLPAFKPANELNQADGSRSMEIAHQPFSRSDYKITPHPFHFDAYLARDFERLAILSQQGLTIMVYESPLNPANQKRFLESPTPAAAHYRNIARAACDENGLHCAFLNVPLGLETHPPYWPDTSHAPAPLLGSYIRQQLIEETHIPASRD
jgi:hypothetical protein